MLPVTSWPRPLPRTDLAALNSANKSQNRVYASLIMAGDDGFDFPHDANSFNAKAMCWS